MTIVAWVGTWVGDGTHTQVVYGSNYSWPNEWWDVWQIDQSIATAIPDEPQPSAQVIDVRALDQAEFDLLIYEYKARKALGEQP